MSGIQGGWNRADEAIWAWVLGVAWPVRDPEILAQLEKAVLHLRARIAPEDDRAADLSVVEAGLKRTAVRARREVELLSERG